jgi:hypothetical protein
MLDVSKGMLFLPRAVSTRFLKLEFTNLSEEPYPIYESGIEVKYTTYDSNEAMYAKLRLLDAGNSYDLVIPSTYYVSKMRKEGLLKPIDSSLLKGFDQLDPRLVHQSFDPDNSVSVPYLWGTTGMARIFPVNSSLRISQPAIRKKCVPR